MPSPQDEKWFDRVRDALSADPEMSHIGRHFDATIAFTFDDDRFDLLIRGGRLDAVRTVHKIDSRVDFGFRAPRAVWDKFLKLVPPPLHHSVYAMIMRVPEFHLDGDSLKFAQNARAVHRLLAIMQETGEVQ